MECVPNFSEGRDLQKIDRIVAPFRARAGVKLLDYSNDEDHNRLVVTVVGEPEPLRDAVLEAIGVAVELIDLNHHQGQHPRMGAVDVVPFIPIKGVSMDEAIALSREVGAEVAARYNLPVFLYEKSATAPHRENLAAIRKGEFEGMAEKNSPARVASRLRSGRTSPYRRYGSHRGTYAAGGLQHQPQYAKSGDSPRHCQENPLHRRRLALLQGHGRGTQGTRYHAGIHQHDRLYPYCPLPRLRAGTHRGTPLRSEHCGQRDYRPGADGGTYRHGVLLPGTGELLHATGT